MLPEVGEAGQIKLLKSKVLLPRRRRARLAGVGSTWRRPASARSASSTTTWSTRRTCSGRSSTRTDRVGMPKVESAKKTLAGLNPDVKVIPHKTAPDVGERPRHHRGLRPHRRRRRQLPDALPARTTRRSSSASRSCTRRSSASRARSRRSFPAQGPCYRCLYPAPPPPDMAPSLPGGRRARRAAAASSARCRPPRRSSSSSASARRSPGACSCSTRSKTKFRELKLPPRSRRARPAATGVEPENIELIDYEQFCAVR